MKQRFYILLLLTSIALVATSQEQQKSLLNLPQKALASLTKKYQQLDKQITQQTEHYIASLEKQEQQLQKKLHTKDSALAQAQLASMQLHYKKLRERLKTANTKLQPTNEYLPQLDSITTAAKFLEKNNSNNPQIAALNSSIAKVQSKLQASAEIKRMMKERKDLLRKQLGDLGVTKQLDNISKQTYYYKQQIAEYKLLLKDKDKAQQKILSLLKENNSFKEFMSKNSFLAKLFATPAANAGGSSFPVGMQTREQLLNELQQKFGSVSFPSLEGQGVGSIQQQITKAKTGFNKIKKESLTPASPNGEVTDKDMPNFKPNKQKTKSFLKRLELGMNIQSVKSNNLLPTTSDIAVTVGYKLNDKSTIGIGTAYKLGWGSGWQDIKLSTQGLGLRSFVDVKFPSTGGAWGGLLKNIWLSGGYELNYLPELKDKTGNTPLLGGVRGGPWQEASLLGLSKKYNKGKKKAQVQLLYNFLYKQTYPQQQPLLFRVGWGL